LTLKELFSHYYKPTPVKVRMVADSVCLTCVTITGSSILADWHKVAMTALIIGAIFKGISNFCVEKEKDAKQL